MNAPVRAAIVYGVCRDCGRANRLLSRDTRTCVHLDGEAPDAE